MTNLKGRGDMSTPEARRPYMPGYGISTAAQGMLPWSWAEERLESSHDYWVASVWPDGRPHVMPVWGVWANGELWFSSSRTARKARNLALNPACVATTADPLNPVVVEGTVAFVEERADIATFAERADRKYRTSYGVDFYADPANVCVRLTPASVFGLAHDDFTGSPTRWTFSS